MKTKVIRYDIEVNLVTDLFAAISPIHREDGSIDELAYSEYQEFVFNVYSALDENEFEVIEIEDSTRSDTSYYFTAYRKSESSDNSIKCLFFIRISDHNIPKESEEGRRRYYKNKAEELKQPKTKKKQTWNLKDIIVNGSTYDSYEAALKGVGDRLKMDVSKYL